MTIQEPLIGLSVSDLTEHLFLKKLSINDIPNNQLIFSNEQFESLIQVWLISADPLWKKNRFFAALCRDSSLEARAHLISYISRLVESNSSSSGHARFASTSAAFLLMCLNSLVDSNSSNDPKIGAICYALFASISLDISKKIDLKNLHPIIASFLSSCKLDAVALKMLLLVPDGLKDSSAFGKFLSEIKGLPSDLEEAIPFMVDYFNLQVSTTSFLEVVDRLSRRNIVLAASIMVTLTSCSEFKSASDAYASVVISLAQSDQEQVQKMAGTIALNLPVCQSYLAALFNAFKSASPKTKECLANFSVLLLKDKCIPHGVDWPDFGGLCAKELNSSDAIISALVYSAAMLGNPSLSDVIKLTLKASQKTSLKASVLLGIAQAKYSLPHDILKELFSASNTKEIKQPLSTSITTFTICAVASSVQNRDAINFEDVDTVQFLRQAGSLVFTEKVLSVLDDTMLDILTSFVNDYLFVSKAIPLDSELKPLAFTALAWLTMFSSKSTFKRISKCATPLSHSNMDVFSQKLEKVISNPETCITVDHEQRIWLMLSRCSDRESLNSKQLALLCHHPSLRGSGFGSWPELIRQNIQEIEQFCLEKFLLFVSKGDVKNCETPSFYLLSSLISLVPASVAERLNLPQSIFDVIASISNIPPVEWDLLKGPKESKLQKPLSSKTSKVASPVQSPQSTSSSLLPSLMSELESQLTLVRAVALALPFHKAFTKFRPELIIKLLRLIESHPESASELLLAALYEIASESLDGQGPLLLTLFLRNLKTISLPEHIIRSWNINDYEVLLTSCVEIISQTLSTEEFSLSIFILSKCSLDGVEETVLKHLFAKLRQITDLTEAIDDQEAFMAFVRGLLQCRRPLLFGIISSLLIEMGQISGIALTDEESKWLAKFIRSDELGQRLSALKFILSVVAASEGQVHLGNELSIAIWLLHFKPSFIQVKCSSEAALDDEKQEDSTLTSQTDKLDISIIATEIVEILGNNTHVRPSLHDLKNELMQLETEKGTKDLHIPSLVQFYISACGFLINSAEDFESFSKDFGTLLANRTVPTGIVRLTKNIDRSSLDFTKLTRRAIISVLGSATHHNIQLTSNFIDFCFQIGFSDPDEVNCSSMFEAAMNLVSEHATDVLYAKLQAHLTSSPINNDRVKVYSVVLLGCAAKKASLDSSRIWELIERIMETSSVPSESVQKAAADTLIPLFRLQKDNHRIPKLLSELSIRLKEPKESYGAIRGVAYIISSLLRACGTQLIAQHHLFEIMLDNLSRLSQKGSEAAVCAALAVVETCSLQCGIAFEPYISPLVSPVLEALGDSRIQVRQDAEACADAMMSALSPLSVALILPPLLEMAGADGCDPRVSWRAKLGAVSWLGSMSNLAPKVLTPALPRIIPALIVALTDAHEKVHLAAHHALAVKYASIIRSPEIKAALPAILRALSDPPKYAASCLGDIIGTSFCHAVDGPSLALLEPLLTRALRERGTGAMTEAKRRSILIISNLGSLMDPAELRPYLANIIPALRSVLGDAVPQVRSGAARSLGATARLMHAHNLEPGTPLEHLIPECYEIIFSPTSNMTSIDRAGSAQAIAQVISCRGMKAIVEFVDTKVAHLILDHDALNSGKCSSATAEALLHLLAALPDAILRPQLVDLYAEVFTSQRISAILHAVTDDDDGVREVATKTARSLVLRQALLVNLGAALEVLLKGAGSDKWRIRMVSFTILSDLLPALSFDSEASGESRCSTQDRTLSREMRCKILSRLYFGRFDINGHIRNCAFSLWKSIVTHPPRVILEILPNLVDDCVGLLSGAHSRDDSEDLEDDLEDASGHEPAKSAEVVAENLETASNGLKDVLAKLADRVLVPLVHRLGSIFHTSPEQRRGCIRAAAIIVATVIVPILTPPHLRDPSCVTVNVSRQIVDETFVAILKLMHVALRFDDSDQADEDDQSDEDDEDEADPVVNEAVMLFARISSGLKTSPVLLERIISEFLDDSVSSSSATSINIVLRRRPQILLPALVARFKKLSVAPDSWLWWCNVFSASGPFLASSAPGLLNHLLKLTQIIELPRAEDDCSNIIPLVDIFLGSISSYDPDVYYGVGSNDYCEADEDFNEDNLEDAVDSGLFSLGQALETLHLARNQGVLAAQLLASFAASGTYGLDRFYDVWLDRLLQGVLIHGDSAAALALDSVAKGAIDRDEAITVIDQLLQSLETRSGLMKNLSQMPSTTLQVTLVKLLCIPCLVDVELPASRRISAARLVLHLSGPSASSLPNVQVSTLLGALIRTISDRPGASQSSNSETLRAVLLSILLTQFQNAPAACKPFHPQVSRLIVNILKECVATASKVKKPLDFESSDPRGEIVANASRVAALLALQMSRLDAFLDELYKFAGVADGDNEDDLDIYDEDSLRNARRVLLNVMSEISAAAPSFPSALENFLDRILRALLILPSQETEILEKATALAQSLLPKLSSDISGDLKKFMSSVM